MLPGGVMGTTKVWCSWTKSIHGFHPRSKDREAIAHGTDVMKNSKR